MPLIKSNSSDYFSGQLIGNNDSPHLASAKKSNGRVLYGEGGGEILDLEPIPSSSPYSPSKKASIKWMGSSYSGSDIEVIAHIYDAPDISQKTKAIEEELARNRSTQQSLLQARGVPSPATLGDYVTEDKEYLSYSKAIKLLEEQLKEFKYLREHGHTTVKLGTLQTVSTQTYRHKFAVRALGHSYPKGYVRGVKTIAGSMIFSLFDEHALSKLIFAMSKSDYMKAMDENISSFLPDQLPPIDLTLAFINEYGSMSRLNIYGAEFLSDSLVFSVEDILSENVLSFVARDIDIFTKIGNKPLLDNGKDFEREANVSSNRASRLIDDKEYKDYLTRLGLRNNRTNR